MSVNIKKILLDGNDYCKICNKPLKDLRDENNWRDYIETCSKECAREYAGKDWPEEEDCPGCPCHINGPHKFSCSHFGKQQLKIPVKYKKV